MRHYSQQINMEDTENEIKQIRMFLVAALIVGVAFFMVKEKVHANIFPQNRRGERYKLQIRNRGNNEKCCE